MRAVGKKNIRRHKGTWSIRAINSKNHKLSMQIKGLNLNGDRLFDRKDELGEYFCSYIGEDIVKLLGSNLDIRVVKNG